MEQPAETTRTTTASAGEPTASTQETTAAGAPTAANAPLGASSFVHELGHLKMVPRSGWALAGVPSAESVAEHSMRTAAIAYVLAASVGANADRAAAMAIMHDVPETRTGDIPSVGKAYTKKTPDVEIIVDQVAELNLAARVAVVGLVREYRGQETVESHLAHDADKLECLAQALEYQHRGYRQTQLWIKGSCESVRTEVGHAMAEEMLADTPDSWWRKFVASYRRPTSNE